MVFYRKYRPQTIKELDSDTVRESLLTVLSGKSAPHAFLFTGPKGLGKTSSARIVAKVVNCEKRKGTDPCNRCTQCTSITEGTNLDVLEIDGASHRGIDEVRDLREKVRLLPALAKRKVYIIDEVHMLTTEAFNALLKTLEEPPPHVMFILCTTEPQKVPQTIASRCFHLAFPIASQKDLVRSFKRIVKGEKLAVDDEVLSFIAQLSDGSFRDGAKILEQLSLQAGRKKIAKQMVEEKFKVISVQKYVEDLLQALQRNNAKVAFAVVANVSNQGIDMRYFLQQFIDALHQEFIVSVEQNDPKVDEIRGLLELLLRAHAELKYAVLPQLPLELAIVEWTQNSTSSIAQGPVGRLPRPTSSLSASWRIPAGARRGPSTPVEQASSSVRSPAPATLRSQARNDLEELWQQVIEKVKSLNHSIAGVLRGCSLKSFNGEKLVIETKYKFHKERLSEPKTQSLIKQICQEFAGHNVSVSILLKG